MFSNRNPEKTLNKVKFHPSKVVSVFLRLLLFGLYAVIDSATPWTVAHQSSLSMGFSRKEYWSGLPFPSPGDLPDPVIKPGIRVVKVKVKSLSRVRLFCYPMGCSLPGFSVHEILQAKILEWVTISFFSRSFQPWNWTQVSCIAGRFFTDWGTRESLNHGREHLKF